jgi:hypothetical protein
VILPPFSIPWLEAIKIWNLHYTYFSRHAQVSIGAYTSGLYYKHITIINDYSKVMLQTVGKLTSIIYDTSYGYGYG